MESKAKRKQFINAQLRWVGVLSKYLSNLCQETLKSARVCLDCGNFIFPTCVFRHFLSTPQVASMRSGENVHRGRTCLESAVGCSNRE